MDISKEDYESLAFISFPVRDDNPVIGEVNNALTLIGRVCIDNTGKYLYRCSCEGYYKAIKAHSQVVAGKFKRCNSCKVKYMQELRFNLFKEKFKKLYSTNKGATLTPIRWVGERLKSKKIIYNCSICSKDSELWPDGSISSSTNKMESGRIPCGCSDSVKWTREQHEVRIKRRCYKVGFSFLGFTGKWKGNCTKIKLYNSATGNTWSSCTIANLYTGRGDPSIGCYNENLKGYFYISIWPTFIKCGITNKLPKTRLSNQAGRSKLEGVLHFTYENEDGGFVRQLETSVLRSFDREVVTKEVFPDGYTETFHKEDLDDILCHVKEYCSLYS